MDITNKFTFLNNPSRLVTTIHILLLILITSLVFSNTLDNEYHLDSIHRVEVNTEVNQFWPPLRFFVDIRTGSTVPVIAEYRPMMPLTHAINSEIASVTGTSKLAGFHVGNIIIHISTVILVYFLFNMLMTHWRRDNCSSTPTIHRVHLIFLATSLFAVHPISGAAVNYIASRDLLLMVFFFIASFFVYINMRLKGDSITSWLISLMLLSLAILSKQVAIIGFGLIFLFEWILVDLKLKDWKLWARTALFFIPTAGFFILRTLWITKQNTQDSLRIPIDIFYPLTMAKAHVFYYLKNFVWPFEMRALAKFDIVDTIADPGVIIGLLFIISSLVIAWWFYKKNTLVTFSILAYWLLFALTSSIFPFRYVVTDYRQYLPSIFLYFIVCLIAVTSKQRVTSIAITGCLIVYFAISSFQINKNWLTEESFWKQSVKYGAVALAHQNYGLAVVGNDPELAEHHYLEAINQYPYHIYANINLALLHIKMGKKDDGLTRLRHMVQLNPNWALAHYWLFKGLKMTGNDKEATEELLIAASLDKRSLNYQYEAARVLQNAGKHDLSIPYFERIHEIDFLYKSTGFWLAFAYQKTGQSQKSIEIYRNFLINNPKHVQGNFNLAYELKKNKLCVESIKYFTNTLKLKKDYFEVHLYLSQCYNLLGENRLSNKHKEFYSSHKSKKKL